MSTIWYTARGAGLAALLLLTVSTVLGALVSRHGKPARRYIAQYVHRVTSGLGVAVLVLHVGAVLADSYAKVGWRGAVIPFTAAYRPTWTGIGTLAAYCFVGVAILGMARGRMAATPHGARVWRSLHATAYLGWATAMLHGVNSGSDSSVGWVRLMYLGCLLSVAGAVGLRLTRRHHPQALRRHDSAVRFPRPLPEAATRAPALLTSGATR